MAVQFARVPLEGMYCDRLVIIGGCVSDVLSETPHLRGESNTRIAERTALDVLDQGLGEFLDAGRQKLCKLQLSSTLPFPRFRICEDCTDEQRS